VRQAFGEDAVVLSTRPCAEGVEVMAMAPEGMQQIERLSADHTASPAISSIRSRTPSESVSRWRRSRLRTTPSKGFCVS